MKRRGDVCPDLALDGQPVLRQPGAPRGPRMSDETALKRALSSCRWLLLPALLLVACSSREGGELAGSGGTAAGGSGAGGAHGGMGGAGAGTGGAGAGGMADGGAGAGGTA